MQGNLVEPLISNDSKQRIGAMNWFASYNNEKQRTNRLPEERNKADVIKPENPQEKKMSLEIKTNSDLNFRDPSYYVNSFGDAKETKFYEDATAVHGVPQCSIETCSILKKDPSISACIVKGYEQWQDINLKELMGLEDYKRLQILRVRNYITIIKMLYRVYRGHQDEVEVFSQLRVKLIQIQQLLKYLGISNEYKRLYERAREGKYVFGKEKQAEENADIEVMESHTIETEEFVDLDEEEGNDNHDSENEYDEFYKQSRIYYGHNTGMRWELLKEEKKWVKRAAWLEERLQLLKCDPRQIKWFSWFQAKMDSLVDLDVNINTESVHKSSKVFYLAEFLDEQMDEFKPESQYEHDQRIYLEPKNFFPKVIQNNNEITNDGRALIKAWTEVREKLCLKIRTRESESNYFLTVFKKKAFGNEKIYEKRINIRKRSITNSQLEFSPCGNYVKWYMTLEYSESFTLIFSLNSKYKDPLLIKPGTTQIGFFNEKFYCFKSQTKTLYQFDLQDYNNVAQQKIDYEISDTSNLLLTSNGVCYIEKKVVTVGEGSNAKENYQCTIWLKNEPYTLEQFEHLPVESMVDLKINQKGDKALLTYWKENNLIFQRFSIEKKSPVSALTALGGVKSATSQPQKVFKKDIVIQPQLKDRFEIDKGKQDLKVVPLLNDFLILFRKNKKVYIFCNDQFVCEHDTESWELYQFVDNNEGTLTQIIFEDYGKFRENLIQYLICLPSESPQDKKLVWKWNFVSYLIHNKRSYANFPYFYYIYNHDQVLMKDLSKPKTEGLYYMNGFLGIDSTMRPLALFGMCENGKTMMMVPTINSGYTKKQFVLKVHSIKSKYQVLDHFRLNGYLRYRIYACNQEMLQVLQGWLGMFQEGQLHNDIKFECKHNAMAIEKWEGRICSARVMMSYYSTPFPDSRDITKESQDMSERPLNNWLFVYQQGTDVSVYSKQMRYSFRFDNFKDMESCWSYQADDQYGQIYDILIDNVMKNTLDINILFANGMMKRFSAVIKPGTAVDNFIEDQNIYSIEQYFQKKVAGGAQGGSSGEKGGGGGASGGSKKVDLWDMKGGIFIANRMLYSQEVIVDFNVIRPNEKTQTGYQLKQFYRDKDSILRIMLSVSELKLIVMYRDGNQGIVVVSPLLNVRSVPLFSINQFTHPVVPMVDKERTFTQVFTLNLENRYFVYNELVHKRFRKKHFNFYMLHTAGFRVKYFNGIEEKIPLTDFGEEFKEIFRFKQSLNGKFMLISGCRYGNVQKELAQQQDNSGDPMSKLGSSIKRQVETLMVQKQDEREKELQSGLFVYEVGLGTFKLVQHFPFAEKDPTKIDQEMKEKMKFIRNTIPEYIMPEIRGNSYNEYNFDYDEDWQFYNRRAGEYIDNVEFKDYDEEVLKQNKIKEWRKNDMLAAKKKDTSYWYGSRADTSLYEIDSFYDQQLEADQDWKDFKKISGVKENFEGFDFPILEEKPYGVKNLEKFENEIYLSRKLPNPVYEEKIKNMTEEEKQAEEQKQNEYDPYSIYTFNQIEREKITKMHANYHLELNDDGDIFLIERLKNRLYYFYKSQADNQYKLAKKKFEPDFIITAADSSNNYLVVSSDKRFQVFKLNKDTNNQANGSPFEIDNQPKDLSLMIDSNPPVKVVVEEKKEENKEEKKEENKEEVKSQIQEVTYEINIIDCKIKDNFLILRLCDNSNFNYVRVFDVSRKINVFYLEGTRIAISGDNHYLWLVEQNQVFDIVNGLSTFFLWPANQVQSHFFDTYDLFNVNYDRTIMVTQGFLQLAFDYISMTVDMELSSSFTFKGGAVDQTKNFNYLYYKIGNNRSIMEKIFREDRDKDAIGEVPYVRPVIKNEMEQKKWDDDQMNIQSNQYKLLSALLNFLTENYVIEQNDPVQITNFFLSYYFIQINPETKEKEILNIFQKMFIPEETRQDLIDDILHYVVNTELFTLQFVINTCFLRFLKTANSSQAFQAYLNNITKQTTQMKELEKFQLESTDEGFFVESYNSPIMDNDFLKKFKKPEQPKKDVSIYYINLGEILSKQGNEIMDVLCDDNYLSMMNIPFIQYLVMYQWLNVRSSIQKRLLIPFFILLGLYFVYATFQIDWYKDYEEGRINEMKEQISKTYESGVATEEDKANADIIMKNLNYMIKASSNFSVLWLLNVVGLLGILSYMYFMEAKQFFKEPREYFGEFWNIIDIFNYSLCFCVIFMDIFNAPIRILRPTASICVIILWIKLFYFLRVFETTSRLVRMILEIVNDMKNFLFVLMIGVVGFANGLYILSQNQNNGLPPFAGETFIQALIYTYRLALGDFIADDYYSLEPLDVIIVWTIFIIASLFVVIVLLNLLIAIMGDTFSRVMENITNFTIREKVMLVSENESLFDRDVKFKNSQYLIIIKEKAAESAQADTWDGQINALKRQMMDKLNSLQSGIDQKIGENSIEMRKRFTDFDEKAKRSQGSLEQKIALVSKSEMENIFTKVSGLFEQMSQKIMTQQDSINYLQEQLRMVSTTNQKLENLGAGLYKFRKDVYKQLKIEPEELEEEEESEGEE